MMKKRDSALKKALKTGQHVDLLIYKGLRNKVTTSLRKAKANLFFNIIKEAKGNSKLIWKPIDKLTGKGSAKKTVGLQLEIQGYLQNDSSIIATTFNNYLIESVLGLGQHFSSSNLVITPSDDP